MNSLKKKILIIFGVFWLLYFTIPEIINIPVALISNYTIIFFTKAASFIDGIIPWFHVSTSGFVLFVLISIPLIFTAIILHFCYKRTGDWVISPEVVDEPVQKVKQIVKEPVEAKQKVKKIKHNIDDFTNDVIVKYFLELYKSQKNLLPTAPGKFTPVNENYAGKNIIYELNTICEGDWVPRRLSIGRLGEDGVSKSKCFYVIYDDHIVVKIPPKPIVKFDQYMKGINADRLIAARISPVQCIIPRISVILEKVMPLSKLELNLNDDPEVSYIKKLEQSPEAHKYLKIENSFAYFMDLSKYYFLSKVLDDMHDMDNMVHKEIMGNPDAIWDSTQFEGRYGRKYSFLCYEIKSIYQEYEREINRLLIQYGISKSLPLYSMKKWFLVHLAGTESIEAERGLSQGFMDDLNSISRYSMADNLHSIEAYRDMIRSYIYMVMISKLKVEMSSIVINLIGLLLLLGKKKVAIRDLKPDNLLITGDPNDYPNFLKNPHKYKIGLIDVETAVDYSAELQEDIYQAQLGGTPKYATPTHMFPNELIIKTFGDLKRIFHLQDWYASVAMIFKVVTGETLFDKTATILPEIKRVIEVPVRDGEQLATVTEYVCRMFWRSAVDEFYDKIEQKKNMLRAIKIIIPENDKIALINYLNDERKATIKSILALINNQSMFKSKANRKKLFEAPLEEIELIKSKLMGTITNGGYSGDYEHTYVVEFFHALRELKKQVKYQKESLEMLQVNLNGIEVDSLLEIMFKAVLSAMYIEIWGDLEVGETTENAQESADGDYEATL